MSQGGVENLGFTVVVGAGGGEILLVLGLGGFEFAVMAGLGSGKFLAQGADLAGVGQGAKG